MLLVLDAEPLLLVDHDQAEVLPGHAGLQQPVRTDDNVDRAVLHAVEHRARLGGVGEARQPLDGDREAGHPLGEGLQVLVGQQRRRHQHRSLFAVLDRLERRPHRDLGLAVADVAADHPVHRDGLLHVVLDLGDGGELVDGLGEPERVLHLGLPRGVGAERVAGRRLALGVQRHQFGGDLPHRPAGLGLRVRPVAATEPRQRRGLPADVPRQLIQRIHRHVQPVGPAAALARRVLQYEVLAARAAHNAFGHLHEPADAVLVVHHQVAGGQGQRVDDVAALGGQPLALGGRGPVARQIGLGDHHEVGPGDHDTVVQRPLEHPDHAVFQSDARFQKSCRSIGFSELLDDPLRGACARGDDRRVAARRDVCAQHREDVVDVGLLTARGRRRPDVDLDRRLVAQLAQRPPRVIAIAGRGAGVVEFDEPRGTHRLEIDRHVAAHRRRRP